MPQRSTPWCDCRIASMYIPMLYHTHCWLLSLSLDYRCDKHWQTLAQTYLWFAVSWTDCCLCIQLAAFAITLLLKLLQGDNFSLCQCYISLNHRHICDGLLPAREGQCIAVSRDGIVRRCNPCPQSVSEVSMLIINVNSIVVSTSWWNVQL